MNVPQLKNKRESGIELLRLVLMTMIICHHFLVHGAHLELLGTDSYQNNLNTIYYLLANSFLVIGVNGFIFISGYYGIKFKMQGLLHIVLQVLFYSFLFLGLSEIFIPANIGIKSTINNFFPISSGKWWFITAYIFLYIFSPVFNTAFEMLDKKTMSVIMAALFLMVCFSGFFFDPSVLGVHDGYSLNGMIMIYCLGRYIKKYVNTDFIEKMSLFFYVFLSLSVFGAVYILLHYAQQKLAWQAFAYNNPLLVLSSIMFFFCFKKISFSNNFINTIASSVLAVYLIHSNSFSAKYLYKDWFSVIANYNIIIQFCLLIITAVVIVLTGIGIEKIRYRLFEPVLHFLAGKLSRRGLV